MGSVKVCSGRLSLLLACTRSHLPQRMGALSARVSWLLYFVTWTPKSVLPKPTYSWALLVQVTLDPPWQAAWIPMGLVALALPSTLRPRNHME